MTQVSDKIAAFERRIAFRLARHQADLDRAAAGERPAEIARPGRQRFVTRARRLPAGVSRRIRQRQVDRAAPIGEATVEAQLDARRATGSSDVASMVSRTARSTGSLELDTSSTPIVSIVIPVHGAIDDLMQCLRSIDAFPPSVPFEVIVANDATPGMDFEPVRSVGGVVIVDNEKNLGFLGTCNRAAEHATGALLWLLNSDTELTPDAADSLVATFDAFPDTGIAGSKLVYDDWVLQEAGGIVWRDGSAWNYGRGDDPGRSVYDYARRADYVSGASLMIDRSLWNDLGGFDTAFTPAYYEDTDLCMQVTALGRSVMYQPGSVVVHHEGKSYGTEVTQNGKHHQVVNQQTFRSKWSATLATHRANGVEPELEKERHVAKRVLVLDARMLTPDMDSGSLRMQNTLIALTRAGCRCTFFPHNMALDEPYAQQLREQGVEVIGSPRVRTVDAFLRARGREFDAVVLSRLEVASVHLTPVRKWCPDATVVYDTVDLHFLREARAARLGPDDHLASSSTRDDELAAAERSDAILVCSTVEQTLMRELLPGARVEVVGNVHMPAHVDPTPDDRSGLLFVGGFEHPPNVDAMLWFVSDILPLIADRHPEVVLHIVGSRMIPEIEALAGDHVVVHGFVADLDPMYRSARVSVAPLRFGAGVKGKVTQALAEGLPAVGTSIAVEGAPVVPGRDVLVADDADGFACHVATLLDDDQKWREVACAGVSTVRRHFGPEAATATLAQILDLDIDKEMSDG